MFFKSSSSIQVHSECDSQIQSFIPLPKFTQADQQKQKIPYFPASKIQIIPTKTKLDFSQQKDQFQEYDMDTRQLFRPRVNHRKIQKSFSKDQKKKEDYDKFVGKLTTPISRANKKDVQLHISFLDQISQRNIELVQNTMKLKNFENSIPQSQRNEQKQNYIERSKQFYLHKNKFQKPTQFLTDHTRDFQVKRQELKIKNIISLRLHEFFQQKPSKSTNSSFTKSKNLNSLSINKSPGELKSWRKFEF